MTYKLFCLDRDGNCHAVREIRALHDADAISQIELMRMPASCEVWQGARLVALLPLPAANPA